MRVLAIDYGDVRTGLAFSSGLIIGETTVITERNAQAAAEKITAFAKERGAETLVLGYPKNMDATTGARAEKSEAFAGVLRELSGLPVILWDERRTTADAHRILSENNRHGKKRKERIDAVAASLILEAYLRHLENLSDADNDQK